MTQEKKCTCQTEQGQPLEFRTELCPIHDSNIIDSYSENSVIITDGHLLNKDVLPWYGHVFVCPKCEHHVMHHMKFCGGCGVKTIIHSKIVTDQINKMRDIR